MAKKRTNSQQRPLKPSTRQATATKSSRTRQTQKRRRPVKRQHLSNGQYEALLFLVLAFSFLLVLGIYFNAAGAVGLFFRKLFFGGFGMAAYVIPLALVVTTIFKMANRNNRRLNHLLLYLWLGITLLAVFFHVRLSQGPQLFLKISDKNVFFATLANYYAIGQQFETGGGFLGGLFGDSLMLIFGKWGSLIVLVLVIICLIVLATNISLLDFFGKAGQFVKRSLKQLAQKVRENQATRSAEKIPRTAKETTDSREETINLGDKQETHQKFNWRDKTQLKEEKNDADLEQQTETKWQKKVESKKKTRDDKPLPVEATVVKQDNAPSQLELEQILPEAGGDYKAPPFELLTLPAVTNNSDDTHLLDENAQKLETTLSSFGVGAKVIDVSQGPTVTRYELQPEQGVKVSKIVNLTDDIALNLAASGIRIEAPIPGKSAVGIEVPNSENRPVYLREVLETNEFKKFPSQLAFGIGKDIGGQVMVADIARMPHLLIAGATGSGKSVCINTLIASILYKASPKDVRLLMIDPKVVELSVYNGVPHLLVPVVTDPRKAAGALNWAVKEMSDRYALFAAANARDLKGYNKVIDKQAAEDNQPSLKKLPQIVIIVDELADLMMVAASDVEDAICRLAQMARAAGIHLIIATQRPSVDVITGLIKANIPSRIAFNVSSGVDSRTILDMNGAEKLLGKGDMLYFPVGLPKPLRLQGAFISDKEVSQLVAFLKEKEDVKYNHQIMNQLQKQEEKHKSGLADLDEYFEDALTLVVEKEKASASMIQRRFRVGYNRAARIVDQLFEAGYVGDEEGSKPRKVLISKEELERQRAVNEQTDDEVTDNRLTGKELISGESTGN